MKGLHKQTFDSGRDAMSWMKEDVVAGKNEAAVRATTMIILHLIDYMESHRMSQTDLARELGVSPQYVNKLLHGQDTSFRIETAIEYGNKLGIKLIEIPPLKEMDDVSVEVPTFSTMIFRVSDAMAYPLSFMAEVLKPSIKQTWKKQHSPLVTVF